MTDLNRTIANLGERFASLRSEFEAGLADLSRQLDDARSAAEQAVLDGTSHGKRLRQLEERAEGQNELIETLTEEAQEARFLSAEIRERDLDIERLAAAIASKDELINALRRQLGEVEELKSGMARQDAELDARRALIRSLREDANRASELGEELELKRDMIRALEDSVDSHLETIASLRRSAESWKQKYQQAAGRELNGEGTTVEAPQLSDDEDETRNAAGQSRDHAAIAVDDTAAVNMRPALGQARSQKATPTA